MQRRAQIVGLYKPGPTMGQIITRDAERSREAARGQRRASYATARLVAAPRGVPLYSVGRGQIGRGEVKFFDSDVLDPSGADPYGLPTVGNVASHEPATAFYGMTEVNCVQQGATSFNRIGAKILVKSINFRATLRMAGSAPTNNAARVMLVYDHQPNGAFPLIGTVISDNISTAPGFHSGLNMANKSRFTILRNQTFAFTATSVTVQLIDWFVKTKLESQFQSTDNDIGDLTTGAIYLIAFAEASSSANYVTMWDAHSRIRFFD